MLHKKRMTKMKKQASEKINKNPNKMNTIIKALALCRAHSQRESKRKTKPAYRKSIANKIKSDTCQNKKRKLSLHVI